MAKKKKTDKKANLAVKIHCKYDALIAPDKLKDHPKNRNKHPEDQITRLAKLYEYQGIRHPIIVGKKSGYIVAGHGRKQAAIKAGIKEVPVVYQVFDSDEQEYAFIQSDNAIALWAELDIDSIKEDFKEFDFKFDLDFLGIEKFTILGENLQANGTYLGDENMSLELGEKNDYILLMFDNKKTFMEGCKKLGIKSVTTNLSKNGNPNFNITGIGRVIDGSAIIKKL